MGIVGNKSSEEKIKVNKWVISDTVGILSSPLEESLVLEPRLSRLLYLLALNEKSIVSRDYLIDQIWTDTIVNEESLTRAVADLRKALSKHFPGGPTIDTVRKRGYLLNLSRGPRRLVLKWKITKKQVPFIIAALIALLAWLIL